MVSTLQPKFLTLIAIHRPLGITILVLALFRLSVRLWRGTPALPSYLPSWQAFAAKASHYLLYGLLTAMPLIGLFLGATVPCSQTHRRGVLGRGRGLH
jgi:cytochrome b561